MLFRIVWEDAETIKVEPVGELVRKHFYFPERGKSSYAFFDETDQTAYLGMNGEYSARAIVGMEWKSLPNMLQMASRFGGKYQDIDLNTSFSVRVDYAVGDSCVKAVTFSFIPMNPRRDTSVPWGTEHAPDEIVLSRSLLTGKTLLPLRNYAPEGWNGRAIITYDMHSVGPDLWAELSLSAL